MLQVNYSVSNSPFPKSFRRTIWKRVRPARWNFQSPRHTYTTLRACKRDPETSVSTTLVPDFIVIYVFCLRFWWKAHTCSSLNRILCAIIPMTTDPSSAVHTQIVYTENGEVYRHVIVIIVVVAAHVVRVYVPPFHIEFSRGFSYTTISRRFRYAWTGSSAYKNINSEWIAVFLCPTSKLREILKDLLHKNT